MLDERETHRNHQKQKQHRLQLLQKILPPTHTLAPYHHSVVNKYFLDRDQLLPSEWCRDINWSRSLHSKSVGWSTLCTGQLPIIFSISAWLGAWMWGIIRQGSSIGLPGPIAALLGMLQRYKLVKISAFKVSWLKYTVLPIIFFPSVHD